MRLVKLLLSDYSRASRDKREVGVAASLGFQITVCSKGQAASRHEIDGIDYIEFTTSRRFPIPFVNHALSAVSLLFMLKGLNYDIISCHDIKALLIGYLASLGRHRRPLLVYDAHEFEIGRATSRKRGTLRLFAVTFLERFLMRRCAFTIVVNDSIADEMTRIHCLRERPVVARSTPYLWERDEAAVSTARCELLGRLGAPKDSFLVMYHGAVVPGRGVETLIRAVAADPHIYGVVLGDGDGSYLDGLRVLAAELGTSDRVLFHPAVPREGLEAYVAAADVGLVACQAVCESYYYMLPNKFFENIQASNPVIASDFPETGAIVDKYGIGLKCDPEDITDVVSCIDRLRTDGEFYAECKQGLERARHELCWEHERVALERAYREAAASCTS